MLMNCYVEFDLVHQDLRDLGVLSHCAEFVFHMYSYGIGIIFVICFCCGKSVITFDILVVVEYMMMMEWMSVLNLILTIQQ